jgi:hypothetical protein
MGSGREASGTGGSRKSVPASDDRASSISKFAVGSSVGKFGKVWKGGEIGDGWNWFKLRVPKVFRCGECGCGELLYGEFGCGELLYDEVEGA